MPTITKVLENQGKEKDRVYVYIDYEFCASIRQRTWIAMRLGVESEINCEALKCLENNFWKNLYGTDSWKREKDRIKRVTEWFAKYIPEVNAFAVGFGADSNEYLRNIHSNEKGAPDLSIRALNSEKEIIALEVSGTEVMRGDEYWVRKDKIEYIQGHIEKDIWIVLHYKMPTERFIWVRIDHNKQYKSIMTNVKGAGEYYVLFKESDSEIRSSADFQDYIVKKLNLLD